MSETGGGNASRSLPHQPRPPRPRLLIVGPLPPPIGGVETFTQAILETQALADFDVLHCDTTKGRPKSTQGRFDLGNFLWAARHFVRMQRALDRHRPDIVYLPIAGNWAAVLRDFTLGWLARRSGARVVGHQHAGDVPRILERRGMTGRVVRAGFGQFDRLLVLGEKWRRLFVDWGATSPIDVCPSTYRREILERATGFQRDHRRQGPLRVLYVGQIGRRKGAHDLLAAAAELKVKGRAIDLHLVGPAQLEGELEAARELADRLSLGGGVHFHGTLEGEALLERYRQSDVFALPSYNEGIPAVLYEAGAFELPVVTTPVGGIPDLIRNERNGLLVEPGRGDQLVAALERLASDSELAGRIARQLRQDVLDYHPDKIGERLARSLRETLVAGAPARGARR